MQWLTPPSFCPYLPPLSHFPSPPPLSLSSLSLRHHMDPFSFSQTSHSCVPSSSCPPILSPPQVREDREVYHFINHTQNKEEASKFYICPDYKLVHTHFKMLLSFPLSSTMWCYQQYARVICTLQNNLTVDVNVTGQLNVNMKKGYHSYAMPIPSLVTAQTIRHSIVSIYFFKASQPRGRALVTPIGVFLG